MAKRGYWLMKSEADVYGIDDLKKDGSTYWEGVRNYQARNFMRDDMKEGDGVLYYHSRQDPPGIVGLARISREAYADPSQFDAKSKYHDPKATEEEPRWVVVDLEFVHKFDGVLPLAELKEDPKLAEMLVAQKGQRLSVQPVEAKHWKHILKKVGYRE